MIRLIIIIALYSLLNWACMEHNHTQSETTTFHTKAYDQDDPVNTSIAEDSLINANNKIINAFGANLAKKSRIIVTNFRDNARAFDGNKMKDGKKDTYWCTDDSIKNASIVIDLIKAYQLNYLLLSEYLPLGKRISKFSVDAFVENRWKHVTEGTYIGKIKIINLQGFHSAWLRINIIKSSASPAISEIAVY